MKTIINQIKTNREPWLVFLYDKFNNLTPIEAKYFILYHKDDVGIILEIDKEDNSISVSMENVADVLIEKYNITDSDKRIILYKDIINELLNITYSEITEDYLQPAEFDIFDQIGRI